MLRNAPGTASCTLLNAAKEAPGFLATYLLKIDDVPHPTDFRPRRDGKKAAEDYHLFLTDLKNSPIRLTATAVADTHGTRTHAAVPPRPKSWLVVAQQFVKFSNLHARKETRVGKHQIFRERC